VRSLQCGHPQTEHNSCLGMLRMLLLCLPACLPVLPSLHQAFAPPCTLLSAAAALALAHGCL
jgi:hypothetical protein